MTVWTVSSISTMLPANAANASRSSYADETRIAQRDRWMAQGDRWTAQVRLQLLAIAVGAGLTKDDITHAPFISRLNHRRYEDVTVNLRRGIGYAIIGVCDEDCSDLDLELYDDNGNLISYDTKRNSTPFVGVTPNRSARFTVRVIMSRCSNAPCRYGIGFFGR